MDKFDTRRVAEGLTAYAIERRHGWERHQREGAPTWMEQRRFWTDAILQGMARLDGGQPDPALMERFDRELEQDRGCYLFTPATRQMQKDTIRELRRFVSALKATGDDRRRQVDVVWKLLEDMSSHLPWASKDNDLSLACGEAHDRPDAHPLHPYPSGRGRRAPLGQRLRLRRCDRRRGGQADGCIPGGGPGLSERQKLARPLHRLCGTGPLLRLGDS